VKKSNQLAFGALGQLRRLPAEDEPGKTAYESPIPRGWCPVKVPALKRVKDKVRKRMVPLAKVVSHQNAVFLEDLSEHIQRQRKMREKLPLVYQYGDRFYLENGNHRIVAMLLKDRKRCECGSLRSMR
jgi:hypothetical protein